MDETVQGLGVEERGGLRGLRSGGRALRETSKRVRSSSHGREQGPGGAVSKAKQNKRFKKRSTACAEKSR